MIEELGKAFQYNPETGELFRDGRLCRHKQRNGYLQVKFHQKAYLGHRIIWALMTGEMPAGMVDHINRDRADNRWENLRLADRSLNQTNRRSTNPLGKGVQKIYGRYRVQFRKKYLGTFDTLTQAQQAFLDAGGIA